MDSSSKSYQSKTYHPRKMLAVAALSSMLYGFNGSSLLNLNNYNTISSTATSSVAITSDLDKSVTNEVETEEVKKEVKPEKKRIVVASAVRQISAYNVGDIYQCSGDPCIAANGENVCKALDMGYNRCAANFVPFGTILEIEGYGECLVTDRMNSRFSQNVDIAMKYEDKQKALNFGRRRLTVNIVRYE